MAQTQWKFISHLHYSPGRVFQISGRFSSMHYSWDPGSFHFYDSTIQPVHPKGNHSWVFIGRADAEVETPILCPPDAKSWLIWKDPDAGKDWRRDEKGMTEDEMVGWLHRLNGHGFGWTLGVGDGQGGLAYCSSWCRKESDTTERLNWTELNWTLLCLLH